MEGHKDEERAISYLHQHNLEGSSKSHKNQDEITPHPAQGSTVEFSESSFLEDFRDESLSSEEKMVFVKESKTASEGTSSDANSKRRYWMVVSCFCVLWVVLTIGIAVSIVATGQYKENVGGAGEDDEVARTQTPVPPPVPGNSYPTPSHPALPSNGRNKTFSEQGEEANHAHSRTPAGHATAPSPAPPTDRRAPTLQPSTSTAATTTQGPTKIVADVVIVGAGWSGLAAMETLSKSGIKNVQILEGRHRIGGRSHTIRNLVPGTDDHPVELGSAWVYADTAVQDMVDKLGVKYSTTAWSYDTFGMYETPSLRQQRDGSSSTQSSELTKEEKMNLISTIWSGTGGFVPFANQVEENAPGNSNDVQQLENEYLRQRKKTLTKSEETEVDFNEEEQSLNLMTFTTVESELGAALDEVSAKEALPLLVADSTMNYMSVPGGGYDKLISNLAEPFLDRIQLDSRVTTIQYGQDNEKDLAEVTYVDSEGATQTVQAAAVLVTVPLGVLKSSDIEFIPGLPQKKLDAINNLGYGTLNKCILYWEDREQAATWWPSKNEDWLGLITEEDETSGLWTLFFNPMSQGNGDMNILVGWIAGDDAEVMESQANDQVLAAVLSNLRTMLGNTVPEPTNFTVTRWGQDEFSKGSYSFPLPGEKLSSSYRQDLYRPTGNLFWAGEATEEDWYATTVGAYYTGVRAGEDIASSFARR